VSNPSSFASQEIIGDLKKEVGDWCFRFFCEATIPCSFRVFRAKKDKSEVDSRKGRSVCLLFPSQRERSVSASRPGVNGVSTPMRGSMLSSREPIATHHLFSNITRKDGDPEISSLSHVYAVKDHWQLNNSIQSKIVAMAFAMTTEIEQGLIL
jgi:hypothetical protein